METWMFGTVTEATMQRVHILICKRCNCYIRTGELCGVKLIEYIPWYKFWKRHTKVDSYHLNCAIEQIEQGAKEMK